MKYRIVWYGVAPQYAILFYVRLRYIAPGKQIQHTAGKPEMGTARLSNKKRWALMGADGRQFLLIHFLFNTLQYNIHSAQFSGQYTVHCAQFTVHNLQCTVCTVDSTQCAVYSKLYSVRSTLYSVYSIMCSSQYTVHRKQCTAYSIL